MPFAALYDALGQRLATERGAERSVLLLYLLLHGCQAFQVCSRPGRFRARQGGFVRRFTWRLAQDCSNACLGASSRFSSDGQWVWCLLQDYAMVRSDLDTVLLPLLHMLYASDRRSASQLYMLLIIVLLLSQDPAFAASVHR